MITDYTYEPGTDRVAMMTRSDGYWEIHDLQGDESADFTRTSTYPHTPSTSLIYLGSENAIRQVLGQRVAAGTATVITTTEKIQSAAGGGNIPVAVTVQTEWPTTVQIGGQARGLIASATTRTAPGALPEVSSESRFAQSEPAPLSGRAARRTRPDGTVHDYAYQRGTFGLFRF